MFVSIFNFIQRMFGVQRNREIELKKGPNWFLITDSFAHYVVNHECFICQVFHDTICCDEVLFL